MLTTQILIERANATRYGGFYIDHEFKGQVPQILGSFQCKASDCAAFLVEMGFEVIEVIDRDASGWARTKDGFVLYRNGLFARCSSQLSGIFE